MFADGKQDGAKSEKGEEQPAPSHIRDSPSHQRRRTTNHSATSEQPSELDFTHTLVAVPAEDWCRTWEAERTIMLRMTSKRVKEIVDKVRPPAVVRLKRSFWKDDQKRTFAEKLLFVIAQLTAITSRSQIITLDLSSYENKGNETTGQHSWKKQVGSKVIVKEVVDDMSEELYTGLIQHYNTAFRAFTIKLDKCWNGLCPGCKDCTYRLQWNSPVWLDCV
jgi:hypothetical protein